MTRLIFVRHGETAWSRGQEHTVRGRIDLPLNNIGLIQAQAVGQKLKNEPISCIYSSPLKRARATAAEIGKYHRLPVIDHLGFIDLDFGNWQGKSHEELEKKYPDQYRQWLTAPHTMVFPKGETLTAVHKRVVNAITELVVERKNDSVVIVTHGVVLRVILCYLNDKDIEHYLQFDMDNCAISIAEFKSGRYSLLTNNDTSHLIDLTELS